MNRRNFLQTALATAAASAARVGGSTLPASDPISPALGVSRYRCGTELFQVDTRLINTQWLGEHGHTAPYYLRSMILRWPANGDPKKVLHLCYESPHFNEPLPDQLERAGACVVEGVRGSIIRAADPHFNDRFILQVEPEARYVANPNWIPKPEPRIVRDDSLVVPPIQPEYQPYV